MGIQIYLANLNDIDDMSRLSKAKRLAYEKVQPKFWAHAGEKGDEIQKAWFKELLDNPEYLLFIAKDSNQQCMGFVIGKLMQSPQVYNPGGLTLLIDDFCVASDALWPSVGLQLLKQSDLSGALRTKIFLIFFHLGIDRVFGSFFKNSRHF